MAIISDLDVKLVGNEVHFLSGAGKSRTLQPHGFYDVVGEVVGGTITISVESLDFHRPSTLRRIGSHVDPDAPDSGPGSVQEVFNCVPTTVELFRGDKQQPVAAFRTKDGRQLEAESRFQFDAGPISGPLSTQRTKFRLRVANTSSKVVKSAGGMEFVRDREAIGQTRVPLRVLNHAFDVVIDALAPRARISGGILHLSFGAELARAFELEGLPFGEQAIPTDLPVDVTGELISVAAEVITGETVLEAAGQRLEHARDVLEAELTRATPKPPGTVAGLRAAIAEIDQQLADLRETFKPDLVAIHISALASTLDLEAR